MYGKARSANKPVNEICAKTENPKWSERVDRKKTLSNTSILILLFIILAVISRWHHDTSKEIKRQAKPPETGNIKPSKRILYRDGSSKFQWHTFGCSRYSYKNVLKLLTELCLIASCLKMLSKFFT